MINAFFDLSRSPKILLKEISTLQAGSLINGIEFGTTDAAWLVRRQQDQN
jgi:hypothetical protein